MPGVGGGGGYRTMFLGCHIYRSQHCTVWSYALLTRLANFHSPAGGTHNEVIRRFKSLTYREKFNLYPCVQYIIHKQCSKLYNIQNPCHCTSEMQHEHTCITPIFFQIITKQTNLCQFGEYIIPSWCTG